MHEHIALKRAVAAAAALLVLAAVVYVSAGGHVEERVSYGCNVCRADLTRDWFFSIPVSTRLDENGFSEYYRNNVDPQHQHTWEVSGGSYRSLGRCVFADGRIRAAVLHYKTLFAIVKSLPDRRTKKAFCEQFLIPNPDSREGQRADRRMWDASLALNAAYKQNPNRKDWPALLRKIGFYP